MTKKIILVLVEGQTDQDTLAVVFTRLVENQDVEFEVIRTDLTAKEEMTEKYIEVAIEKEIEKYFRRNPYLEQGDILKVVQLIDTDGAFVPASMVRQSKNRLTEYHEDFIEAKDKDRLIRRNISKRRIVYQLYHQDEIAGFPYEVYYFSRNLEHVLHNEGRELSVEEKEDLALEAALRYHENPEDFLRFIGDETFSIQGGYRETWDFIMANGNSLKRHTNLLVFFNRLGIGGGVNCRQ